MSDPTERRVRLIADLATLTLLIDKDIISPEEAIQRIELIQSKLDETFRSDDVKAQLSLATAFLQSRRKSRSQPWNPTVVEGGLSPHKEEDQNPPTD